jgi:hypothetical protein
MRLPPATSRQQRDSFVGLCEVLTLARESSGIWISRERRPPRAYACKTVPSVTVTNLRGCGKVTKSVGSAIGNGDPIRIVISL